MSIDDSNLLFESKMIKLSPEEKTILNKSHPYLCNFKSHYTALKSSYLILSMTVCGVLHF